MAFSRFGYVALVLAGALFAVEEGRAQTLRERLQKARELRESAEERDSGDGREPSRGRRMGPLRGARGETSPAPARRGPPRTTPLAESAAQWVNYLGRLQPKEASGYADLPLEQFAQGVSAVEYWTGQLAFFEDAERPGDILRVADQLLATKAGIDGQLERAFEMRASMAAIEPEDKRNEALAKFLWSTAAYIDLSGRLRYTLYDALNFAADETAARASDYNRLLELLIHHKSGVGAAVVSSGLFDPPPSAKGAIAVSLAAKLKVLELIADCGNYELAPEVAELIKQPGTSPQLVLAGAASLARLGFPQAERPGQDPTLPRPPITPGELAALLTKLDVRRLTPAQRRQRDEVASAAAAMAKTGLVEDKYQLGSIEIQPGDWLLMRNPSPYNLFTDLSPGLFTHVGVATIEKGTDGVRRMVIVDIPERGPEMPATNVDAFVQRTRHFVFLRHPDPATAKQMADAAAATVGNVTEFDLNFRTERILGLKGQPLAGKKIHTYCAGLLYLCALQTDRERGEFFPLAEGPAGGYTAENLAKFGFSFGEDFISPTGAFFSPTLKLVGRREPMYDPPREIEEAVFDHFAQSLLTRQVTPAPDAFQILRLKVAEAAKDNPLLAKAVASAAGVSDEMDLVAAAKAKALVETLDEIAYGASGEFITARQAIVSGGVMPAGVKLSPAEQSRMKELLSRHSSLAERWRKNQLSPRALRTELVQYYIAEGKRRLEQRFFAP